MTAGAPPEVRKVGVGMAAGAAGTNASTSLAVIMPSMPDPEVIWCKSTPRSAATLLAAGLAKGRAPAAGLPLAGEGAGGGIAAGLMGVTLGAIGSSGAMLEVAFTCLALSAALSAGGS